MIKQTDENYSELLSLFHEEPHLFEEIDPSDYIDEDGEGRSSLYCNGEADLIEIDGKTYRFYWDDVIDFDIEES